jgi:hypothetical protein
MASAGRVSGFGLSTKVGVHFKEDSKTRKERRRNVEELQRLEIADLKAQTAVLPTQMEEKFKARLRQVIPPQLWEGLAAWNATGGVGPILVPSVSGSNSAQHVLPNMVTLPSYPSANLFTGLSPPAAAGVGAQHQHAAAASAAAQHQCADIIASCCTRPQSGADAASCVHLSRARCPHQGN